MSNLQIKQNSGLVPDNINEAMQLAEILSKSTLVPKQFSGNPSDTFVAMQWGFEIGLSPMQALQNISVINGRPSLWGDAMLALVQSHSQYESHKEYIKDNVAYCEVKRKGCDLHVSTFSKEDAILAGLWGGITKSGKATAWKSYPERMLKMRARGFALRDQFADALKGLISVEEARDYPTKNQNNKIVEKEIREDVVEIIQNDVVDIVEEDIKVYFDQSLQSDVYSQICDSIKSCETDAELKIVADVIKEKKSVLTEDELNQARQFWIEKKQEIK
tara:strand:+ start:4817 stop:5641 length:825 start_codon:yes stop_codon:yes gene_type:complete